MDHTWSSNGLKAPLLGSVMGHWLDSNHIQFLCLGIEENYSSDFPLTNIIRWKLKDFLGVLSTSEPKNSISSGSTESGKNKSGVS